MTTILSSPTIVATNSMDTGLLEDWLQRAVSPSSSPPLKPSTPSAQQIAHAWSQLRLCVQSGILKPDHLAALVFLRDHGRTLHVAEPQARLLLSVLSSVISPDGDEDALGQARGSAALLLSTWLRRAFVAAGRGPRSSPTHVQEILDSVVDNTLKTLQSSSHNVSFINEVILLLGTVCVVPHVQEQLRRTCQEAIARECVQQRKAIIRGRFKEALAGMGYAMVSSSDRILKALLQALLLLWADGFSVGHEGRTSMYSPQLEDGLLLLHLMEWYGSILTSQPQHAASFQTVVEEVIQASNSYNALPTKCAVVLSAAGLLRSFHRRRSAKRPLDKNVESSWMGMVPLLESMIIRMVDGTSELQAEKIIEEMQARPSVDATHFENWRVIRAVQSGDKHWLQCISLAVSRCTRFPPSLSVFLCLIITFLEDALPLSDYYNGTMSQGLEGTGQSVQGLAVHVEGILFHEAGAIFRVICEQYQSADKGWQLWIENLFSQYSHFVYQSHRYFLARINSKIHVGLVSPSCPSVEHENGALRKLLEAVLLSVVMLFSFASKQKMDADIHAKGQFAAQVLSSLSCMEFIRQGQVPEYSDLVQRCVTWVTASEATCAMLVSMFPSYDDIIRPPVPALASYNWMKDMVQDARVLFGFRVLPSCLHTFPVSSFLNEVAPTMFLYMKHPTQILVQASHSLLVAFLSTNAGDSEISFESDRDSIKEQLAVRFIERTFEEFPVVSHYDAFVTGVGAIARQLPAGSTATMCCITSLARRASELFSYASREESLDKGPENKLETGKKLQTLLLHLILIVDIQVLSHLLQEVARLILGLPGPHRMAALEEAFDTLAGSDDLTRKHILVPWLQSLSYLCSNLNVQGRSPSTRTLRDSKRSLQNDDSSEAAQTDGAIALNPSSAMMVLWSEGVNTLPQASRSRL